MSTNPHDPANAARIGDLVRQLREAQSMSKAELYRRSGVAESTVSRIEAGIVEPTLETLTKLADALNANLIDLAELIGLDEDSVATRLPEPATYFRTKYNMTAREAAKLESQFAKLLRESGIDPAQPGPAPGEDE